MSVRIVNIQRVEGGAADSSEGDVGKRVDGGGGGGGEGGGGG